MNTEPILELGCDTSKLEGAFGLDNVQLAAVDILHDLFSFPNPFSDESRDVIYLRRVIEHFE